MSEAGILEEVASAPANSFACFLVPKGSGRHRLIFDMSAWTPAYAHSPAVTLPSALSVLADVRVYSHAVRIDLTDGFYHVPMAGGTRDLFSVECAGRFYRFAALPMGWSLSPLLMQIAMTAAVKQINSEAKRCLLFPALVNLH